MGRKAIIREVEEHRRPIEMKTWQRGEPEEKLRVVIRSMGGVVGRRKVWLEYLCAEYEKTNNPLYAWDARSLAREWGLPVPAWVEEYLDRAGKTLLHAEKKADDVSGAFGFKGDIGKTSLFRQYERQRAIEHAKNIVQNYINRGESLKAAIKKAVAEVNHTYGTDLKEEVIRKQRYSHK